MQNNNTLNRTYLYKNNFFKHFTVSQTAQTTDNTLALHINTHVMDPPNH